MVKILNSTRKGVASLYVVLFATMLFGVIVLSFVRIIFSEKTQTSNSDLSRSAYDSAMAGVEDAKMMINRYYKCLSNSSSSECDIFKKDGVKVDPSTIFNGDCEDSTGVVDFPLKRLVLGPGSSESEVKIQESSSDGNNTEQAYTCVIIKNTASDYRSTLTSDNRIRVVPLSLSHTDSSLVFDNGGEATDIKDVDRITFSWYSQANNSSEINLNSDKSFPSYTKKPIPPVISLTLLRANGNIDPAQFSEHSSYLNSTMILMPSSNSSAIDEISWDIINWSACANKGSCPIAADIKTNYSNEPFPIKCSESNSDFICSVSLTNLDFQANDNVALAISLPYGDAITDFAVNLYRETGGDPIAINFKNAQITIDSTGRANQLVRRVETRLDTSDLFFPYPQFALELTGSDALTKSFWITNNCWTETGTCPQNGSV